MWICIKQSHRTILSGTKLDALQRALRVRAMDGAHQKRKGRKGKQKISAKTKTNNPKNESHVSTSAF
jgi:hypothetical protein